MNTKQEQLPPINRKNLLIGLSGSVAAIKLHILVASFDTVYNVRIIMTQHARKFIPSQQLQKYSNRIFFDDTQWNQWQKRGDPVLHIQLRKWADLYLIAPLSANSLAKISNGICDNLLTLVCRAWNMQKNQQNKLVKPIVVCPSMNVIMWEHPITKQQIEKLQKWGYYVFGPIEKVMMCGDVGNGAMAEVSQIFDFVKKILI